MIASENQIDNRCASPGTTVVADALTRIPTAYYADASWAQDSVATCARMLARAAGGDRTEVRRWLHHAASVADERPLTSVLRAVCEALVAQSFRSRGTVRRMSRFVVSIEREVLTTLERDRQRVFDERDIGHDATALSSALVQIMRLHDADTAAHLEGTAVIARQIAHIMALPARQTQRIELAARLHDIGKIGVPQGLLNKPDQLTQAELQEIRLRIHDGAAALQDTPILSVIAPIVRAQHERFDGDGPMDRPSAYQLLLESRIVGVADALHSMTSKRSYRPAFTPAQALERLTANAGSQFDPAVVAAACTYVEYNVPEARRIA